MSNTPLDQPTFEEALAELDQLVRELEDGRTGLEESLVHYEKGVGLLKHCYRQLQEAEKRILLLTGADEEGKPVARPFEHSATVKAEPKTRKKVDNSEKLF